MKREVVFARLHDIQVVHPRAGNLDRNLPPSNKTYKGLKMYLEDGVLEVEIDGISAGVPTSNVQYMQFTAPKPDAGPIKPKA